MHEGQEKVGLSHHRVVEVKYKSEQFGMGFKCQTEHFVFDT